MRSDYKVINLDDKTEYEHFTISPRTLAKQGVSGQIKENYNYD